MRDSMLIGCLGAALGLAAVPNLAAAQVDASTFIEQSLAGLASLQSANDSLWHMREHVHWDVDQDTGQITFSFADGKTATAPIQIVGTFNPDDSTFMWAWDHPSIDPALKRAAGLTLDWAQKNNVDRWTTRLVTCTEAEAWEFTAVAARLDGAGGAFRAPTQGPLVFLVFGEVTLSKVTPK